MQGTSINAFSFSPKLESCPACGSASLSFWGVSQDADVSVAGFDHDQCTECLTIFTNPRPLPDSLSRFYSRLEGRDDQAIVAASLKYYADPARRADRMADYLEPLLAHRTSGRLLDFGCGAGWFAALARDAGFEVEGIEQMPAAVRAAREVLGLAAVRLGDETDIPAEPTYDVIVSNNVIEHMADPADLALRVRRALKPGGCWMLNFPSADAEMFRAFGAASYYFMTPYHLTHFSEAGLKSLLQRTGFEAVSFGNQTEAFYWGRGLAASLGLQDSLERWRQDPEFVRFDIALDALLTRLANASGTALNQICFAKVS